MNKTKRFCAIALAAMMAVTAFAGCGGSDTTTNNSAAQAQLQQSAATHLQ